MLNNNVNSKYFQLNYIDLFDYLCELPSNAILPSIGRAVCIMHENSKRPVFVM